MKTQTIALIFLLFGDCVLAQDLTSSSSCRSSELDNRHTQGETTELEKQRSGFYWFDMPENEMLRGCEYTQGYSFPDVCKDEKGDIIFDLLKDNQNVLDKIIQKQGKKGKYNKIENGIWVRRKPGHSVPEQSIDVTGLSPADAERKAALEAHGYDYHPPLTGEKDYVEDYFVMPENEMLDHCTYVIGYSFPATCFDSKGDIVFDATKDNQKVLDKIIKQEGKQGKYNKMPNGGPVKVEGVELPKYKNLRE